MKLVVYNSYDQYAISRSEIEAIRQVLPRAVWSRIRELHLAHSHPKYCQPFEFDEQTGIAYLIVPVKQKTQALRTEAIAELLLGLGRVQAKSRFFHPLKPRERAECGEFVAKWLSQCEAAILRLHEDA